MKNVMLAIYIACFLLVRAPGALAGGIVIPGEILPELPIGSMEKFLGAIVTNMVHAPVRIEFTSSNSRQAIESVDEVVRFTGYEHYQNYLKDEIESRIQEIRSSFPNATGPFCMRATITYNNQAIPYEGLKIEATNSSTISSLNRASFDSMVVKDATLPVYLPTLYGVEVCSSGPTNLYTWYNSEENVVTNQNDYFPLVSSQRGVVMLGLKHALGERYTRVKIVTVAGGNTLATNVFTQDGDRVFTPVITLATNSSSSKSSVNLHWASGSNSRFEVNKYGTNWSPFMSFGWTSGSSNVTVRMPVEKFVSFRGVSE